MTLTPLDVQHKVFDKQFRGYDRKQVDQFLEEVAHALELLIRENATLKDRVTACEHELSELRQAEATLTNTLITTQRFVDQLKGGAQQDAERIVKEAELKADNMLLQARTDLAELQRALADLRRERALMLEQIRATLKTFERILELEDSGAEEGEAPSHAGSQHSPLSDHSSTLYPPHAS
ncbi:MAG: DivIVA domain-containing protein [Nitrospirae bacterium]|nr:MAG: DivIVA domain-containing protein [Nitrospirota bacterium]